LKVYDLVMREHANFIVAAVSAAAVIIVVPAIWQDSLMAWVISSVLLLALLGSTAIYVAKSRGKSNSSDEIDEIKPAASSPVAVNVISAHDQAKVTRNKVRSTVNIYNAQPPTESAPSGEPSGGSS
jgi:hypothetical protein